MVASLPALRVRRASEQVQGRRDASLLPRSRCNARTAAVTDAAASRAARAAVDATRPALMPSIATAAVTVGAAASLAVAIALAVPAAASATTAPCAPPAVANSAPSVAARPSTSCAPGLHGAVLLSRGFVLRRGPQRVLRGQVQVGRRAYSRTQARLDLALLCALHPLRRHASICRRLLVLHAQPQ